MQATIFTKFLRQTESKGMRIKATCNAGTLTRPWSHELSEQENHSSVALELAKQVEWFGDWHGGMLPDFSGFCFVRIVNVTKDPHGRFKTPVSHCQPRAFNTEEI